MKKKTLSLLLALSLTLPSFPFSVTASESATDVIVELTLPDGMCAFEYDNAYEYALACAEYTEEIIPSSDCTYIYDTLLCGFHAKLPVSAIDRLQGLEFVEKVYISGTYSALSDTSADMLAAEAIEYTAAETHGLTGDGIKVAVIDSGFDVTHPAFDVTVTNTLDLTAFENRIAAMQLNAQRFSVPLKALTYNTKLPFVYDYYSNDTDVASASDHGTHVAGIIGAGVTEGSGMRGIAPECQMFFMKIFNDGGTLAYDHLLIAAMEDALKMGADVINLSLGYYSGSSDESHIIGLQNLVASAERTGCIVVAAAGNESVSTEEVALASSHKVTYPLASYTDYGTLASPSSSASIISVASVDNSVYYGRYLTHAKNHRLLIEFSDTNVMSGVTEVPFTEYFNGKQIEYVPIPGVGELTDYEDIDVSGKLALVQRGTISFVDKVNNAASRGAVGVIVYNNVTDEEIGMELTGATLPAIAISMSDGEALIAEPEKLLDITASAVVSSLSETAGKLSAFSSWGTTPSLDLKPDIAGVGGGILSTVDGGNYDGKSGTSMSAPQVTGVFALLTQAAYKNPVNDKPALRRDIINTVMNTAIPVKQDNGVEYSPRAQGAGLVNVKAALERELEITYKENGRAKVELYDGLDKSAEFTVTVKNLTSEPISFALGATLTSDGYTELEVRDRNEYYSSLEAVADTVSVITADGDGNVNRYSDSYSPLTLTLGVGESRDVTIKIVFDAEYHSELSKIFTNGHFAEGYVYAETDNSSVSLPYMGYIGDWAAAPISDGNSYNEEVEQFHGTRLYVMVDGVYTPTGIDAYAEKTAYMKNAIAFSPNGDGSADEILLGASIIRNFKAGSMKITDAMGNTVYTSESSYVTKVSSLLDPVGFRFWWDGGDGMYDRYKFPDGKYTMTVEYTLDYKENKTQSYSYEIILDTMPPKVSEVSMQKGKLSITASDDNGILAITLYGTDSEAPFTVTAAGDSAAIDLSAFKGEYLYYEIVDYAYNTTVGKLRPDGNAA